MPRFCTSCPRDFGAFQPGPRPCRPPRAGEGSNVIVQPLCRSVRRPLWPTSQIMELTAAPLWPWRRMGTCRRRWRRGIQKRSPSRRLCDGCVGERRSSASPPTAARASLNEILLDPLGALCDDYPAQLQLLSRCAGPSRTCTRGPGRCPVFSAPALVQRGADAILLALFLVARIGNRHLVCGSAGLFRPLYMLGRPIGKKKLRPPRARFLFDSITS